MFEFLLAAGLFVGLGVWVFLIERDKRKKNAVKPTSFNGDNGGAVGGSGGTGGDTGVGTGPTPVVPDTLQ